MERTFTSIWFLLVVLLSFCETGFGIRCYQCNSRRDSKCADPISDEIKPVECTRDSVISTLNEITYAVRGSSGVADVYSGSMYNCLKLNSMNNNQYQNITVVRGCYYEKMDGRDICTMLRSKVIDQTTLPYCETCTGDACNGSNQLISSISLMAKFLPILTIYSFYH